MPYNQGMRPTNNSVPVVVTAQPPMSLDVDVVVVAVFQDELPNLQALLDSTTAGVVSQALASREFTGKAFSIFLTPVLGGHSRGPARVMIVGAGPRAPYTTAIARKVATTAALSARDRKLRRVAMVLPGGVPGAIEAQAMAEGLTLAAYSGGIYKKDPDAQPVSLETQLVCPAGLSRDEIADIEHAAGRGYILAACTNLARALANEPANVLTPRAFADIATEIGAEVGLAVDVLDEQRMAGLGMGMLLGVARGSDEPPRMVVMRYRPARPSSAAVLGLVGKGVTFDTGGISLKTSDGMHLMKTDMSGGAAVLAAMKAIAALKPGVSVIGVVPLVENMPGGRAVRPGDVLRSADGQSVEVLDTDAEGRLVLGDALWYARHLGATHLVDVATLTGAIGVALGRTTTGLFGYPEWWVNRVAGTANAAGDRAWIMPLFDDYKEQLRSDIADLCNIGGKPAGSITAALFVKEFAGGLPWAHLDIAGTAWADEAQPFQVKGPTGVAVRTLAELACTADLWPM